jgi:hypothetical protein
MPVSDKTRRQRELDQLAFGILASQYTGPESWMRSMEWLELTKVRRGEQGLGHTTFSDCIKRLLDQGRIRRSQIAKNIFYQPVFVPGNLSGMAASGSENGESDHDPVAPAPDKAAQALAFLLNRKSPGVV